MRMYVSLKNKLVYYSAIWLKCKNCLHIYAPFTSHAGAVRVENLPKIFTLHGASKLTLQQCCCDIICIAYTNVELLLGSRPRIIQNFYPVPHSWPANSTYVSVVYTLGLSSFLIGNDFKLLNIKCQNAA